MLNKVLETPVDLMVDLIKKNKNCSLSFLKDKLSLSLEIIEKWLVILEEFHILKVHYKGLEGYVQLIENKSDKNNKNNLDIENLKDTFVQSSKNNNISYDKMKVLWPIFIKEQEVEIQKLFIENAKKLKYSDFKIKQGWNKYKIALEEF